MKVKPHMTKKRGVNNRSDMNREVYVVGVIRRHARTGASGDRGGVRRRQLILHAGDVGGAAVLESLSALAPVEPVLAATSTTGTIRRSPASAS